MNEWELEELVIGIWKMLDNWIAAEATVRIHNCNSLCQLIEHLADAMRSASTRGGGGGRPAVPTNYNAGQYDFHSRVTPAVQNVSEEPQEQDWSCPVFRGQVVS